MTIADPIPERPSKLSNQQVDNYRADPVLTSQGGSQHNAPAGDSPMQQSGPSKDTAAQVARNPDQGVEKGDQLTKKYTGGGDGS